LEIVGEPDLHSAAEAKAYCRELYLLMKYADVSDVDLYHGNMRFDVNVSVSQDPAKPGKRAEVKNLNSFRSVENAISFEIERQIGLYEKGQEVPQETRGWDDDRQKTTSQRGKEESHDYRYMPEPDVPPVELEDSYIAGIKSKMPKMPAEIREILNKLSISPEVIEDVLDNKAISDPVISQIRGGDEAAAKRLVFWLLQAKVDEGNSEQSGLKTSLVSELSEMVDGGQLNSNAAQEVFDQMLGDRRSPKQIAEEKNLIQMSDEGEIEKVVAEVLDQNQQAAQDIKSGEMKAIGFLVGQVMAKSGGKANPQLAQQIIKKQLGV
ncbi:Asp-tRNA(Asn)/Glu-tRNA(Gln) amidotransferase subunit GatB, partial [Candidatus Saccharibacteria bacterium]|nr:Asp-tRNA(Asn)/Glu-tRNA(Gln) amidotransferase subunit GatB [Candidatus Saccharibacteria bacterium]